MWITVSPILEKAYEGLIVSFTGTQTVFFSPTISTHDLKLYNQYRNLLDELHSPHSWIFFQLKNQLLRCVSIELILKMSLTFTVPN